MDRLALGHHDPAIVAVVGADENAAREEIARVEAADRRDMHEALVGHMADEKADLVHVAGQHDALGVLAFAFPGADERAHHVGLDRVEEIGGFLRDEVAHAMLVARHAGGLAQPLQKIDVHGVRPSEGSRNSESWSGLSGAAASATLS